jgi:hypothetical protein
MMILLPIDENGKEPISFNVKKEIDIFYRKKLIGFTLYS